MPVSSKPALLVAAFALASTLSIATLSAKAQDTPAASELGYQLAIPTVVAVGSSMDESAIRDALSGNFLAHVDELAQLTATSITIPEITMTTSASVEGVTEQGKATYRNLILNDVKNGVAASVSMDGIDTTSAGGTFSYGKMTYTNFDLAGTFALIGLIPPKTTDFGPLYSDYKIDGATITGPEFKCTMGAWSGLATEARPVTVLLKDVIAAGEAMQKTPESPEPGAIKTVVTYVTDLLTAFRSSPTTINGLDCEGTADGKPISFGFGNITVGQFVPGVYPNVALTNFKFDAGEQGVVSIEKVELKQIDLNPPVEVLRSEIDKLNPAWFEANARLLIPSFAGFDLQGVKMDVPNPEMPGSRIQASLGSLDLTLADYLNGLPTKISSNAVAFDIPLPDDSADPQVQMLKAMGFKRLNLNYDLSASWDKTTSTLTIDKAAVSGNDLGSVALAAVIGNASEQLFDIDTNVQQAASLNVTLRSISLDVGDAGLGDIVVPLAAGEQGADPAAFRQQVAAMAEGAAIAMLGSSDGARAVGKALSDFVTGAQKNINITVTSKDPAGLPVPLLIQSQNDPTVLQSAVDVTATTK